MATFLPLVFVVYFFFLYLDHRLYVSPVKPPTPAQKKIRVTDWLWQDSYNDYTPSLHSVRQRLKFHSQPGPVDIPRSIPKKMDFRAYLKPDENEKQETGRVIPVPEGHSLKQVTDSKHRNSGKRKLRQPSENKTVNRKMQIRPPQTNVSHSQNQKHTEQTQPIHNTDDDELWEFQQIEEKMELDEFAEVEAMINEGHEAEASEELLHGIHLTEEPHAVAEPTEHIDTNTNQLSSVRTSGSSSITTPKHRESQMGVSQSLLSLTRKQVRGKPPVNDSKQRQTSRMPQLRQPTSRSLGTAQTQSQIESQSSRQQAPRSMVPTFATPNRHRELPQPQRSLRPPSKLGMRQSTSTTDGGSSKVVEEDNSIDDDESWKEGCF